MNYEIQQSLGVSKLNNVFFLFYFKILFQDSFYTEVMTVSGQCLRVRPPSGFVVLGMCKWKFQIIFGIHILNTCNINTSQKKKNVIFCYCTYLRGDAALSSVLLCPARSKIPFHQFHSSQSNQHAIFLPRRSN